MPGLPATGPMLGQPCRSPRHPHQPGKNNEGPRHTPEALAVSSSKELLDDLGHGARTNGAATLTDREALTLFKGDGLDQLNQQLCRSR